MPALQTSSPPLFRAYDAALFDLDGVIYIGKDAVPGVVDAVNEILRTSGTRVAYVTNNASRSSKSVAAHLCELGLQVLAADVVTSAQAGAAVLASLVPRGSRVFVLGSRDLMREVEAVGLVASQDIHQQHFGVIQGYWPDMPWRMLAQAASVLHQGVPWVATNMDVTIPTEWGPAPGNGAMVNALASSVGRRPDAVAGKPEAPLMHASIRRVSSARPLVVGDRLDTDILGANNVGIDSLLVLSGVTTVADLLVASPELRPTYVAWDARGLLDSHDAVVESGGRLGLRDWHVDRGRLMGTGDVLDAIRVAAVGVWRGALTFDEAVLGLRTRGVAVGLPREP